MSSNRQWLLTAVTLIALGLSHVTNAEQDPLGKAYLQCLDNAKAKAKAEINCDKTRQSLDDNMAGDSRAYSLCLGWVEAEAKKSADSCYDQVYKKPSLNPFAGSGADAQTKAESIGKKDQSKAPQDKSGASGKQVSNPKSDRTQSTTSVSEAQARIQADLDQCTNYQNQAVRCCGNPLNCAGSMSSADQQSLAQLLQSQNQQSGQSMTDYCNQLRTQSANSGSVNNALAQVCASPQASCVATCSSMTDKYLNLANSNQSTDVVNAYLSAADQFMNAANVCERLASRASQLAAQGINSGSTQSMSQACQQATAANPTTMTTPTANPIATGPTTTLNAGVGCQSNPSSPECGNQNSAAMGTSGFDTQAKDDIEFDVPDIGAHSTDYFASDIQPRSAATVGTVPNNSGGGFGTGGGSTSASLNSGGGRPSPGSPGYTTDIMQGTRSGGGYSYESGSGSGSGLEGSSYRGRFIPGRDKQDKNDDGGMLGLDLRQFLPGGSRAHRALAGFNGRSEIHAKEENIWRLISNKMIEKCKLGVLWRCE